jgi:hypothetical protein
MTFSATPSFICPRSWLGMVTHQDSVNRPGGPRPADAGRHPSREEAAAQAARSNSTVEPTSTVEPDLAAEMSAVG